MANPVSFPVYLGDYIDDSTIYVYWNTFGASDESITLTGLATSDIEIYKNGSATQRSSDAGYTLLDSDGIDFDTSTGCHGFSVDLSDNSDDGFFAIGNDYMVMVNAVTVNAQTVRFCAATFSIENRSGVQGAGDFAVTLTIRTTAGVAISGVSVCQQHKYQVRCSCRDKSNGLKWSSHFQLGIYHLLYLLQSGNIYLCSGIVHLRSGECLVHKGYRYGSEFGSVLLLRREFPYQGDH